MTRHQASELSRSLLLLAVALMGCAFLVTVDKDGAPWWLDEAMAIGAGLSVVGSVVMAAKATRLEREWRESLERDGEP